MVKGLSFQTVATCHCGVSAIVDLYTNVMINSLTLLKTSAFEKFSSHPHSHIHNTKFQLIKERFQGVSNTVLCSSFPHENILGVGSSAENSKS